MAMPAAAARPRPLRARRGSRQTAGRACLQIDRICTHNECTRHNSTAAPGGSRATIVTSDRHAARLVFQSADEPSRFFAIRSLADGDAGFVQISRFGV